eukprot:1158485-Pelagomonas_calceolata.AAC.11
MTVCHHLENRVAGLRAICMYVADYGWLWLLDKLQHVIRGCTNKVDISLQKSQHEQFSGKPQRAQACQCQPPAQFMSVLMCMQCFQREQSCQCQPPAHFTCLNLIRHMRLNLFPQATGYRSKGPSI